ncbi:MAG: response regulator [Treponema sp.]|nr:response regulator [Treponema sp.]
MKRVLIADSHSLFRDFLKQKLTEVQIEVIVSQENRDLQTKLITSLPNLIILDINEDDSEEMEFLEQKVKDSNTASIPVIITGPKRDAANIAPLTKYGVIKYFEKPVKLDVFFNAINKTLHTSLIMDDTPCVLDLHRNNNIIFVEIAQGLNREKIALMQFKLAEMIENESMDSPKIIVMLTSLDFNFTDGFNIEFLIDNILACPGIHQKNLKLLSTSEFVKDLIDGHKAYSGIEVASNLPKLLNGLIDSNSETSNVPDLITDQILTASFETDDDIGSLATRFTSDEIYSTSTGKEGSVLSLAIIDSDENNLQFTKQIFESVGAIVDTYTHGQDFSDKYEDGKYNLVILDVFLADKTGLSLLNFIKSRPYGPPVIIYSPSAQKEIIAQCLKLGAKSYILKPQKPNVLIQKSLSILHFSE